MRKRYPAFHFLHDEIKTDVENIDFPEKQWTKQSEAQLMERKLGLDRFFQQVLAKPSLSEETVRALKKFFEVPDDVAAILSSTPSAMTVVDDEVESNTWREHGHALV